MNELVTAIRKKLNIEDDVFINAEIEDYISFLKPTEYQAFFNALTGEKFARTKGIDRVAIVSASFKEQKQAQIQQKVPSKAKDLYNKLYSLVGRVRGFYSEINYLTVTLGSGDDKKRMFSDAEVAVIGELDIDRIMERIQDAYDTQFIIDEISKVMKSMNEKVLNNNLLKREEKELLPK